MNKIILIFCGAPGKGVRFPMSILVLAHPLLKANFEVELCDLRVEYFDPEPQNLNNVLLVGLSVWTGKHSIPFAIETSQKIKKIKPDIPIIWGGPHPTSLPEETIENDFIDIVVRGQGEECLLELANKIAQKEDINDVAGITYKQGGKIISTLNRNLPNINKVTHLPYNLLKLEKYPNFRNNFDYISSRGCPHRCAFCSETFFYNRKWLSKDAEVVMEELDNIVRQFNPTEIAFNDSNFFVDKKRAIAICRSKIKKGYNFKISTDCRFDYFSNYDDEMLHLIKKAGINEILFGGESGSDKVLQFLKKDICSEQILESVRKAKKHGIEPIISFIMGFPEETKEDRLKTLAIYDQVMQIHSKTFINGIFVITPFPMTDIYNYAKANCDYKTPATLQDWAKYTLYETENINWLNKIEKHEIITISLIARYFYILKLLHSWTFKELTARHHSFIYACISYIFNYLFYIPAKLRWKTRYFQNGYEFRFWNKILQKFTGKK